MRVPVGVWTQDLPPSRCAKRHHSKEKIKRWRARPERKENATAYLHVRYNEDTRDPFDFFYCDDKGKGADSRFICFGGHSRVEKPGLQERLLNKLSAEALAILMADECAAERVEYYNMCLLIYLMRCRLMRVLSETVPASCITQRQPNPTAIDLKGYMCPKFIEAVLLKGPFTGERAFLQQIIRYWRTNDGIFSDSNQVTLPKDFWEI